MTMRKTAVATVVCALAAVFGLLLWRLQSSGDAVSAGIIGRADGPTSILISRSEGNGLCFILLMIGAAAVIALTVYRKRHKMK